MPSLLSLQLISALDGPSTARDSPPETREKHNLIMKQGTANKSQKTYRGVKKTPSPASLVTMVKIAGLLTMP